MHTQKNNKQEKKTPKALTWTYNIMFALWLQNTDTYTVYGIIYP